MDYDEYDDEEMPLEEAIEDYSEKPDKDDENNDEKALEAVIKKSEEQAKKRKQAASGKVRPKLTERELMDEKKGLVALKGMFVGYKPSSKDPYDNLKEVMKKVEYWGHNLFPKSNFEDLVTHVERLGKKRAIKIYMNKLRLGINPNDENVVKSDEDEKGDENTDKRASPTKDIIAEDEDDDFYQDDFNFNIIGTPSTHEPISKAKGSDIDITSGHNLEDDEDIPKKKNASMNVSARRAILSDSEDENEVGVGPSKNTQNEISTQNFDLMNEDEIMDYLFKAD